MPFTKGNEFWKLRSKHGRDRLFKTPEMLWEAACEYFEWCEENPECHIICRGKEHAQIEIPKKRAFTITGLCMYLDCDPSYLTHFEKSVKDKTDGLSLEFCRVISRIRLAIVTQNFTGSAAGLFNTRFMIYEFKRNEAATDFVDKDRLIIIEPPERKNQGDNSSTFSGGLRPV